MSYRNKGISSLLSGIQGFFSPFRTKVHDIPHCGMVLMSLVIVALKAQILLDFGNKLSGLFFTGVTVLRIFTFVCLH